MEAAEAYEARFVPAIFADWVPHLVEAAGAGPFDAVLCQSALMFFPDRVGALREMARVAAAGGTVAAVRLGSAAEAVATW